MKHFPSVICLVSLVLIGAQPAKGEERPAPAQVVNALAKEIAKKSPAEKLDAYLKLLEDPYIKTNSAAYGVYQRIATDAYVGERADKAVREYLESPDSSWAKRNAINRYARYRADQEKYDEAIAFLRGELQKEFKNPRDKSYFYGPLVNVYEWADRFDDGIKVCREWMAFDSAAAGRSAIALAANWDREDLQREFGAMMPAEAELGAYAELKVKPSFALEKALKFVTCATNTPNARINAYVTWFGKAHGVEADRAYESVMSIPDAECEKVSVGQVVPAYNQAFCNADWANTVRLWNLFSKCKRMAEGSLKTHSFRKHYAVSLARLGRTSEAIAACDRFAAEAKDERDILRFKGYAAMLRGEKLDTEKLFDGSALDAKARSEVVRSLARQALAMELCDYAEDLSAKYSLLFAKKELRSLNVAFSPVPVRSISDWRGIYKKLDKGYCDQPFGVSAEMLVTDVTTQRKIGTASADDNDAARMEISAVCDVDGLHFFLRVKDHNARKIENGFASGLGTEMYFAPGENVNYVCFGSEPTKGVSWGMNTGYDSAETKRVDFSGKVGAGFRSEVAFTDEDYVCHFTFGWECFYNHLPVDGNDWKFECIAWTPKGGMTWSALTCVHAVSEFGTLKFALTKEQQTAIRRGLLLRSYRSWKTPASNDGGSRLAYFDMWKDDVVGDPDFYNTCLKDLQEKLESAAARVKPDMSDADVNEVFETALNAWLGLGHEIDRRRRQYLLRKLTEE